MNTGLEHLSDDELQQVLSAGDDLSGLPEPLVRKVAGLPEARTPEQIAAIPAVNPERMGASDAQAFGQGIIGALGAIQIPYVQDIVQNHFIPKENADTMREYAAEHPYQTAASQGLGGFALPGAGTMAAEAGVLKGLSKVGQAGATFALNRASDFGLNYGVNRDNGMDAGDAALNAVISTAVGGAIEGVPLAMQASKGRAANRYEMMTGRPAEQAAQYMENPAAYKAQPSAPEIAELAFQNQSTAHAGKVQAAEQALVDTGNQLAAAESHLADMQQAVAAGKQVPREDIVAVKSLIQEIKSQFGALKQQRNALVQNAEGINPDRLLSEVENLGLPPEQTERLRAMVTPDYNGLVAPGDVNKFLDTVSGMQRSQPGYYSPVGASTPASQNLGRLKDAIHDELANSLSPELADQYRQINGDFRKFADMQDGANEMFGLRGVKSDMGMEARIEGKLPRVENSTSVQTLGQRAADANLDSGQRLLDLIKERNALATKNKESVNAARSSVDSLGQLQRQQTRELGALNKAAPELADANKLVDKAFNQTVTGGAQVARSGAQKMALADLSEQIGGEAALKAAFGDAADLDMAAIAYNVNQPIQPRGSNQIQAMKAMVGMIPGMPDSVKNAAGAMAANAQFKPASAMLDSAVLMANAGEKAAPVARVAAQASEAELRRRKLASHFQTKYPDKNLADPADAFTAAQQDPEMRQLSNQKEGK